MTDKSNEYGYVPSSPTQAIRNNTGVFEVNDINNLIEDNKWTSFGQLELIETQTVSSPVAQVDFTSIQESTYDVHLLTANDIEFSGTSIANLGIRFFENGVIESSAVYQFAYQRCGSNGTFSEPKSTAINHLRLTTSSGNGGASNGYNYFYNLGDSTKYSFQTMHSSVMITANTIGASQFGSGVLPQASTVNGIRFFDSSAGQNIANGTFSLYGIRYS